MSEVTMRTNLRLREARRDAGFDTASEFAAAAGVNRTTYLHHENGRRTITQEAAQRYARLLRLPAGTLLYGEKLQLSPSAQLVGHVNTEGDVVFFEPDRVRPIKPRGLLNLLSLDVTAMDLAPRFYPGDRLYYQKLRPGRYAVQDLHNIECVVELRDGRILVRRVIVQSDGRATLLTPGGQALNDVTFHAAAPIVMYEPYLPNHLADHVV